MKRTVADFTLAVVGQARWSRNVLSLRTMLCAPGVERGGEKGGGALVLANTANTLEGQLHAHAITRIHNIHHRHTTSTTDTHNVMHHRHTSSTDIEHPPQTHIMF